MKFQDILQFFHLIFFQKLFSKNHCREVQDHINMKRKQQHDSFNAPTTTAINGNTKSWLAFFPVLFGFSFFGLFTTVFMWCCYCFFFSTICCSCFALKLTVVVVLWLFMIKIRATHNGFFLYLIWQMYFQFTSTAQKKVIF